METAIHYRAMQPGEEPTICEMIAHVFYAFVAPEYSEHGIQEFLRAHLKRGKNGCKMGG